MNARMATVASLYPEKMAQAYHDPAGASKKIVFGQNGAGLRLAL
jgi:hypothetical protein